MKDLGPLHHLCIYAKLRHDDLFLWQHQYALDIIKCTGMTNFKPYTCVPLPLTRLPNNLVRALYT
jgi:hypothetical protein